MTEAGGPLPTGLGSVVSLPLPVDDHRGLIGGRERGPANRILALGVVGQLVAGLDDLPRLLQDQRLRLSPARPRGGAPAAGAGAPRRGPGPSNRPGRAASTSGSPPGCHAGPSRSCAGGSPSSPRPDGRPGSSTSGRRSAAPGHGA